MKIHVKQLDRPDFIQPPPLNNARHALTDGIHLAFVFCATMAALAIFISVRLPHYEIGKKR